MIIRATLLFLLIAGTSNIYAQKADTIWYNSKWEKTEKANGYYYRTITKNNSRGFLIEDHYPDHRLQMRGYFSSLNPDLRNGEFTWWYANGKKEREATYKNNEIIKIKEWDSNGNITREQEIVNVVQKEEGIGSTKASLERAPAFPGGSEGLTRYLQENNRLSKTSDTSVKVIVRFTVDSSGKAINPEIVQSDNPIVNEEALRLIMEMPRWKPGRLDGKNVAVGMQLPMTFTL